MRIWGRALVSFGVLGLLLLAVPWAEVRAVVARLSGVVWIAVLAGFLAGHRLGVAKWRLLLNAGRSNLGGADALRCYSAGLFANLCLPSIVGGDVLRAALAAKATGRPEAVVIGGLADRVLDVAALGMLITAGGLLARDALPGWGGQAVTVLVVVGGMLTAGALPLVLRRPLARWPRRLRRTVGRGLAGLRRLVRDPLVGLLALALALTIQGGFVLLNVWVGRSIGVEVPLAVWFLAWPLAKLSGLLPISLGGLGVRDATFAAILVAFGVPLTLGMLTSLLWQSVLIAGGLVGGAVWWWLSRTRLAVSPSRTRTLRTSPHEYV